MRRRAFLKTLGLMAAGAATSSISLLSTRLPYGSPQPSEPLHLRFALPELTADRMTMFFRPMTSEGELGDPIELGQVSEITWSVSDGQGGRDSVRVRATKID